MNWYGLAHIERSFVKFFLTSIEQAIILLRLFVLYHAPFPE